MKVGRCLWGVLCAMLFFVQGAWAFGGVEGKVRGAVSFGVSDFTGRGNLDEPVLKVEVDVVGEGTVVCRGVGLELVEGTFLEDVVKVCVYSTGEVDYFDPRAVERYVKLGECLPEKGEWTCPLEGRLVPGEQYLWVTCDIAGDAVEGHRVGVDVKFIDMLRGSCRVERSGEASGREILLARRRVYAPGDFGSKNYRIPAIVTAADGSLVIATDKRKANQADLPEDIDVLVNRSTDGGLTWSAPVVVAEGRGRFQGFGDAALVRTREEGGLVCVFVGGAGFFGATCDAPNRTYVCKSRDNGQTWSRPRDITGQLFGAGCADTVRRGWAASFCASGAGLLGRDGTIYLVAAVRETDKRGIGDIANYVYYSEDDGDTWQVSACVKGEHGNEAKIVELDDGRLLVSIRNQASGARYYATSGDKGKSWSSIGEWPEMVEPGCNGDMIRYTSVKDGHDRSRLLHSVPAHPTDRKNVSVFLSYDEGRTWPVKKSVCSGGSAYSSLCVLEDGTIGVYLEEDGGRDAYSMYFINFSLDWLTDGKDRLLREENK